MKILIVNGLNLNLLGTREPEIYGTTSMEDYLQELRQEFAQDEILYYQSNIEGSLSTKYKKMISMLLLLILEPSPTTLMPWLIA